MAAWLPMLKTVLPYLTTIVTAAVPAFTARKDDDRIAELQEAARRNGETIRLLAEQMQRTVHAIEAGATANERMLRKFRLISAVSLVVALISLCVTLVVLLVR